MAELIIHAPPTTSLFDPHADASGDDAAAAATVEASVTSRASSQSPMPKDYTIKPRPHARLMKGIFFMFVGENNKKSEGRREGKRGKEGGKRGEGKKKKIRITSCRRSFHILSRSLIPSRARSEISFERDLKRDLSKNGVSQSLEHDVSR